MNDEQGRALQGRKSKRDIVVSWRRNNPDGRKVDCIKELGIDRKTVSKYWNEERS